MRTLSKHLFLKLAAQAEEADLQGLEAVSNSLTNEIEANASNIREDNASYVYASEQLHNDIKSLLWKSALRAVDYYNTLPDARDLEKIIDAQATDFIEQFRKIAGNPLMGAFEPTVPGEEVAKILVEIEE